MNITNLPAAGWDLVSFFENARNYVGTAGGGLLALMGTVGVVWGGVLLIKKLMASQQDQTSWIKILGLVLVGGALMVGGFSLISNIAAGGRTTIEDLGGGMILLQGLL
ncbi:hypothetical protein PWG71_21455 [Nocardiopsis sp. N85]|uniref:hypothetical protein n=1 Tax=Nocardiopsis sp. N85 TaxID=3029400 RepID=UPI00237F4191|nr:hypothetical protein [Nocardiopsis sp. N85]MDE3723965.1 hypothetical protein [Nocardiopsis sp. N85]